METSNKQTAVEWLIEKTTESGHLWITDKPYSMDELSLIIEKAKEMEKNSYICSKCKSQINGNEIMQQMQDSEKSD